MSVDTNSQDLHGSVAVDGKQILGAMFFSRLSLHTDVDVFILAPLAVHTDHQGRGKGKALITHGLREMRRMGASYVTTCGDPSFHTNVGFQPISEDAIAPLLELSQPEGWLGQSLMNDPIEAIPGRPRCVKALDDPTYW